MFKKLVLAGVFAMPASVHAAALMGFDDSTMFMGEIGRYYQEVMVNYSPSIGHALGAEYMRMEDEDEDVSSITALNYTGLIKRWNMKGGQANFWFTGGIGESHGDGKNGFAYTPGLQFDYETTRLYFLAKARLVRAPGMNFDTAAIQGGFSFYETGFDQTQPWFVLEARTMRNMDPGFQLTPALRLINKDYFLELGVSSPFDSEHRAPRLNFMFLF
jgi:hypothetical protein